MCMIGFYHRFIARYTELSYPLYDLHSSYDKEPKPLNEPNVRLQYLRQSKLL